MYTIAVTQSVVMLIGNKSHYRDYRGNICKQLPASSYMYTTSNTQNKLPMCL